MYKRLVLFVALIMPLPVFAGLNEGIAAYEEGDFDQAVTELLPLARAGDANAMTWLGKTYAEGMDKPAQAVPWYLKAAQKGNVEAQVRLGELYAEGEGLEQDEEQAVFWFEQAAALDDDEAQLALGIHYQESLADNLTALGWFEKSAGQGNADAQYHLGLLLLGEPGVTRQPARAWMFLSLAAEASVDEAAEARDVLELGMSPEELADARRRLQEWQQKHP